MRETVPVLVMLPPAGDSQAERWVAEGRSAATLDLVQRLRSLPTVGQILALVAEERDRQNLAALGVDSLQGAGEGFHFGRQLAEVVHERQLDRLAYFGGASAPLLTKELLEPAFQRLAEAAPGTAWVNNLYSTDWILLNQAERLTGLPERLPSDNSLGWVLSHEAGFQVHTLETSAATRADIDTPTDLIMLAGHPDLGDRLQAFLRRAPKGLIERLEKIRRVLASPGSNVTLIGRSSSQVWRELEQRTEVWVRLFVEERGMVASGRLARGEVCSLLAKALDEWGPRGFVDRLAELTDAVLWDTRVWMASRGGLPPASDRFASDLGWEEHIEDPWLLQLTRVVNRAQIPVLLGGHGVVAGGVYALLESLGAGGNHQPDR